VPTPLLICADDFGYDAAVDEAIASLVAAQRVTATSCLVLSPRWHAAAPLARGLFAQADVGLHLDLTEYPHRASLGRVLVAGRLGLLSRARLRERVATQLARFEDTLGQAPRYVDGHEHVHQLPTVSAVLLDELARRYAGAMPWIRVSAPAAPDLKGRIIGAVGATALRRRLDAAGVRHTRRLLGVYDFGTSPPWLDRAAVWLSQARAGDALMVHPATRAVSGDPLALARVREHDALASPRFVELLASHGVVPARGDSLPAAVPA